MNNSLLTYIERKRTAWSGLEEGTRVIQVDPKLGNAESQPILRVGHAGKEEEKHCF